MRNTQDVEEAILAAIRKAISGLTLGDLADFAKTPLGESLGDQPLATLFPELDAANAASPRARSKARKKTKAKTRTSKKASAKKGALFVARRVEQGSMPSPTQAPAPRSRAPSADRSD